MDKELKKKDFVECLFDFMSDPAGLTQEDLLNELKEQGVDVDQLEKRVAEIVKRGSEERRLSWRKRAKQRISEIEKLIRDDKIITDKVNLMDKIKKFIGDNYGPETLTHAEAYFRKMDNLSENDLISLFEDLERLEFLEKSSFEKD